MATETSGVQRQPFRTPFVDFRRVAHDVDLAAVIGQDTELRRSGDHWVGNAPGRSDSTPSLHVWEPGTGRNPGNGWNFYDFGAQTGGGLIQYLQFYRGLDFDGARTECARLLAQSSGDAVRAAVTTSRSVPVPFTRLETGVQQQGAQLMVDLLAATRPNADRWLRDARGLDPTCARGLGDVLIVQDREHAWDLADTLRRHHRNLALQTGLLHVPRSPKGDRDPRFFLWDQAVILVSRDRHGKPVSVRARRTGWSKTDPYPKYVAQGFGQGVVPHPFGVSSIPLAAREGKPLLILEGALDAAGATQLGHRAIGIGQRPGFPKPAGAVSSAKTIAQHAMTSQGRWFSAHRADLARIQLLQVVPDNDPGKAGILGREHADQLVAYLRSLSLPAEVQSLCDYGLAGFKDFAQAADPLHR